MTTEEKRKRLKQIDFCLIGITATYDLGLEFHFLNPKGETINIGNYSYIPFSVLPVTDEIKNLQKLLQQGFHISLSDLKRCEFITDLCSAYDIYRGETDVLEDADLYECINQICKQITNIELKNNIYAFRELNSWSSKEVILFNNEEELVKCVKEQMTSEGDEYLYDNMTDEDIDNCYKALQMDFNGLGFAMKTK